MRKVKEKDIRIENWCEYDIRFINIKGNWYAVLKDLCDALGLRTDKVNTRLDPDMLEKVVIPTVCDIGSTDTTSDHLSKGVTSDIPSKYNRSEVLSKDVTYDHSSNGVTSSRARKSQTMLVVNEEGIYETLFASRKLEARKFRRWTFKTLKRLRSDVGLKGWEVLKMTDKEVQDEIDFILDTLYWDPEKKCVMQSVTVQGGDVEQRFYSR